MLSSSAVHCQHLFGQVASIISSAYPSFIFGGILLSISNNNEHFIINLASVPGRQISISPPAQSPVRQTAKKLSNCLFFSCVACYFSTPFSGWRLRYKLLQVSLLPLLALHRVHEVWRLRSVKRWYVKQYCRSVLHQQ